MAGEAVQLPCDAEQVDRPDEQHDGEPGESADAGGELGG